ncbi:MAG: hypothetical protein GXO49_00405 [Chlorobi bacterium]|nr:hypothetical protein [Chlorobiota bacterium]
MKNININFNRIIGIILSISIIASLSTCKSDKEEKKTKKEISFDCTGYNKNNSNINLNINILLDLSDRINPVKNPNKTMPYYKRDMGYINSISEAFQCHIANKKLRKVNDQIKVFVEPESDIPELNEILNELKLTYTKNNITLDEINDINSLYNQNISDIYAIAIKQKKYDGSNIWGFFKNKVKDHIKDGSKNVLVIITDGYIYDKQNTGLRKGNKLANFTSKTIRQFKLNNSNWEKTMQEKKIGILPANENLENLEVLVLGLNVNKKSKNPYELEVLKKLWENWLEEMGVKKYEIKTADLPSNLDETIKKFITE